MFQSIHYFQKLFWSSLTLALLQHLYYALYKNKCTKRKQWAYLTNLNTKMVLLNFCHPVESIALLLQSKYRNVHLSPTLSLTVFLREIFPTSKFALNNFFKSYFGYIIISFSVQIRFSIKIRVFFVLIKTGSWDFIVDSAQWK